jgi:hypothetical protein
VLITVNFATPLLIQKGRHPIEGATSAMVNGDPGCSSRPLCPGTSDSRAVPLSRWHLLSQYGGSRAEQVADRRYWQADLYKISIRVKELGL